MKTLTTLIFVLLTIVATAQNKPTSTVYLKNGSVIKGRIIENNPQESVKIQTADKSIWVFKNAEVEKIDTTSSLTKTPQGEPLFSLKKGYFTQAQIELMPSKKKSDEGTVPSILGVFGYQLNKHFSAGIGTGVEAYHISMMPVFAEGRYYFLNDRITPFINIKGGYAFPLENGKDDARNIKLISHGGIMAGAEVGFLKSLSSKTALSFSLGYRYQHLKQTGTMNQYYYPSYSDYMLPYSSGTYMGDRKISTDFHRIIITLGIRFW
ncbi:MAG: hypothetical protein HXX14_04845 [Bacteroidetes bacterium]|nr:hypothetical protein [Bacteroidota bacterium]